MRRYSACICGLSVLLLLSGCQTEKNTDSTKSETSVRQDEASETRDIFAMDSFDAILVGGDGSITITQGLQDSFQSDNPYTVVTE